MLEFTGKIAYTEKAEIEMQVSYIRLQRSIRFRGDGKFF